MKYSGYISAFGFVIITVVSSLFIEKIIVNFPDKFLVIFASMLIATLFFNLINLQNIKTVYTNMLNDLRGFLILSALIGLNWLCSIFGVIRGNLFIYNLFYFMVSLFLVHITTYYSSRHQRYTIFAILVLCLLILATYLNIHLFYGIVLATVGGISSFLYRKTVVSFARATNFTASQILMTRFLPFMIFIGIKANFHYLHNLIFVHGFALLIFSGMSLILPTYLNQSAILKIGAEKSIMISAIIFPLSWFVESLFSSGILNNRSNFWLAIFASILVIAPYINYSWFNKHT